MPELWRQQFVLLTFSFTFRRQYVLRRIFIAEEVKILPIMLYVACEAWNEASI